MRTVLLPLAVALAILLAWAGLATRYPTTILPSPLEVAVAAWANRVPLLQATANTALASVAGLGIALCVGIGGAVAFLRIRWLELALYPYALALQTVPIIIVAPLLVVWLGYGKPVAIATAAMISFFPVLASANLGLRSAPPEQVELLQLYGASPSQLLWKLQAPSALPYVFSGLRTAVGLSVIGAIVGEFVGSYAYASCLGQLAMSSLRGSDKETSFAAIAMATLLALVLFSLVRALERRMIGPWHPGVSA